MNEKYIDFIGEYENITRFLVEVYNIPEEVIDFATDVYGVNKETFNNIIEHYTSYHDIWQLAECDNTIELSKDYDLELFEEDDEDEE